MRMVLKQKCLILMYVLCNIEDTYNVETLSDSSHQMCIIYITGTGSSTFVSL